MVILVMTTSRLDSIASGDNVLGRLVLGGSLYTRYLRIVSLALMDVCLRAIVFFLYCYITTCSHGIKIMTCLFDTREKNIG